MAAEEEGKAKEAKTVVQPPPEDMRNSARWGRAGQVCAVALLVTFVIAAVGRWDTAVNRTYPIKQAIEWNWRARATNNLADMATNLNRSLAILGPFHGNPSWWFPTPDTDLDQIALNIGESRDTALAVSASEPIGSFGYQQAVQNLQETIIEINEHLELAKGWYVTTPAAAGLVALYLSFTVLGSLYAGGAYAASKGVGSRPAIRFALVWIVGSTVVGALIAALP